MTQRQVCSLVMSKLREPSCPHGDSGAEDISLCTSMRTCTDLWGFLDRQLSQEAPCSRYSWETLSVSRGCSIKATEHDNQCPPLAVIPAHTRTYICMHMCAHAYTTAQTHTHVHTNPKERHKPSEDRMVCGHWGLTQELPGP